MQRTKIRYGDAPAQFGHLYVPDSSLLQARERIAVVVMIHGGYWSTDFSLVIQTPIARDLARRAVIVWNIEYRRVGDPDGQWLTTSADILVALNALDDAINQHVSPPNRDRVDTDHLIALGHSSGGQLALWAAAQPRGAAIATVIAQAPASDLECAGQRGHQHLAAFMGGNYDRFPHRYRQASPAHQPVSPAHFVLIHGDADDTVPVEMSAEFVRAARGKGQSAELVSVADAGHADFLDPNSRAHRETLRAAGISAVPRN